MPRHGSVAVVASFLLFSFFSFNFLFVSSPKVPLSSLQIHSSLPSALFIHSETCGPCFLLAQTLKELEQEGKVIVTKVIARENPEICRKFSVGALPTLVLDFPDGRRRRLVGNVDKAELLSLLE